MSKSKQNQAKTGGLGKETEPMVDDDGSKRWQQVEEIVRHLEPRIIEMLREKQIPPSEAASLLEDIVTLLLYRWKEVSRPEAWVLEMVRNRIKRIEEARKKAAEES